MPKVAHWSVSYPENWCPSHAARHTSNICKNKKIPSNSTEIWLILKDILGRNKKFDQR